MSRRLLPLAMVVSLWPVAFIIVSVATASKQHNRGHVDVTLTTTSTETSVTSSTISLRSNGRTYYCPAGTVNKLNPIDQRAAASHVELTATRKQLARTIRRVEQLDRLYPNHTAPTQAIANDYNRLVGHGRTLAASELSLVRAYNEAVDEHNHILKANCT